MAEQRSRDVVDQTLSGGEPSLSDVPASNEDKHSAGGDGRLAEHTATTSTSQIKPDQPVIEPNDAFSSQAETGGEKDAGVVSMVGQYCREMDGRRADLIVGLSKAKRRSSCFQGSRTEWSGVGI